MLSAILCLALTSYITPASDKQHGFVLPPGFSIAEVAGPELANDIYCMTIGPRGEVLVAGRGYIKQLVDDNGDGQFDRAELVADHPKDGAMGLLFDGEYLYFVGDGGLRRIKWQRTASSSGVPSPPSSFPEYRERGEVLLKLKTGGEHDAHAISRGPDGAMYLLMGNTASASLKVPLLSTSPITRHTAGTVLRLSPDFQSVEIICDGLRNAYCFDWSLAGELYTYDSDNERCLGLPWYEGCRFYRIERGGHYGWRSPQKAQSWRMPPYYPGIVAPLVDLGRGSPTGVLCYRHQQVPTEYRGDFYLLDWTFGIVHRVKLKGETAEASVFLKVAPGHGFAPTAIAQHPQTGDVYLTSGGRGTRGAVYRVRHEAGFKQMPAGIGLVSIANNPRSKTLNQEAKPSPAPESWLEQLRQEASTQKKLHALCQLLDHLGEMRASSPEYAFQEGYHYEKFTRSKLTDDLLKEARQQFPSQDTRLNRELGRAFALLQDDSGETIGKLLNQMNTASSPVEDTHYLFVLACCRGPRTSEQTRWIANSVIQLDQKYERSQILRERHWAQRMKEAVRGLIDQDGALPAALLTNEGLGRPDHLLYLTDSRLDQEKLAAHWLRRVQNSADYPWSAELVTVLSHRRDPEVLKLLRARWEEPNLREAILPVLVKSPQEEDRQRFCTGLLLLSADAVKQSIKALERLPLLNANSRADELVACYRAFKYWLPLSPALAQLLKNRLDVLTDHQITKQAEGLTPSLIEAHLLKAFPNTSSQLQGQGGIDLATWKQAHPNVPWQSPRLAEGERHFKKLCANCHQGSTALGPDLTGVGKRFSRDDLLTTILQPSKDVSARYRTSVFVTHDGQTHVGLVIYEAVDGIILQTGASTTIRIAGNNIASQRATDQSLMPSGLLDSLSDQDVADLIGWLQK